VLVRRALRLRQVANWANLSTPLGLLVARLGRARTEAGPDGLVLARGYRLRVPAAPAFTVGNVVLERVDDAVLARRPRLLVHESRHATQYALCAGPLLLPLYGLAALWSWLRAGDPATCNVFERLAGLEDGGYPRRAGEVHDRRHG
jgi:hypothetical protein